MVGGSERGSSASSFRCLRVLRRDAPRRAKATKPMTATINVRRAIDAPNVMCRILRLCAGKGLSVDRLRDCRTNSVSTGSAGPECNGRLQTASLRSCEIRAYRNPREAVMNTLRAWAPLRRLRLAARSNSARTAFSSMTRDHAEAVIVAQRTYSARPNMLSPVARERRRASRWTVPTGSSARPECGVRRANRQWRWLRK